MAYFSIYSTSELVGNKIDENSPIADLAAEIRRLNRTIRDYARSALRGSMDLGDRLSWARGRAEVRKWKAWRCAHCPEISRRQDEVCRQLAGARAIIERALEKNPDLSIREALKLISTSKTPPKPKPEALQKWGTLTADDKRAGLAADSLDAFLKYMPPGWLDEFADKVARVKHATARDRGLSKLLREHVEKHPDDPLAKYVRKQLIDRKHLVVHVAAVDAPSKRRPPLVDAQMHAGSAVVH
jgi:hypothetical protein